MVDEPYAGGIVQAPRDCPKSDLHAIIRKDSHIRGLYETVKSVRNCIALALIVGSSVRPICLAGQIKVVKVGFTKLQFQNYPYQTLGNPFSSPKLQDLNLFRQAQRQP